jgi:transposase
MATKTGYDSDVSDEDWAVVAPYLTLMAPEAPQRVYEMRTVFNGLRWIIRDGAPWRMMSNDLPPWHEDYEQIQRCHRGCGRPDGAVPPSSRTCCGNRR